MRIPKKPKNSDDLMSKDLAKILKLLENKEVRDFITQANKEYLHWDKVKYKSPKGINSEHVWALIKFFRKQQYKKIRFSDWKFNYLLFDDALRKLHLLDKSTAGYLEGGLETVNTQGKERYIINSIMEEAIASSQLEGAATTRRLAKEMLRSRKKPKTQSEKMIVNGYLTMQKIISMKNNKTITTEDLLELHKSITKDTLKEKDYEGKFRDSNDVVVADPIDPEKIYHNPPDHEKLQELMKEFCEFASNDDHDFIHPIIKGIILHFMIGYIHPFIDGNGRVARTIFYWYVLSRGYWLFEFTAVSRVILKSKKDYGLAYLHTEHDDNDLTYFINYNLKAIEQAVDEMQQYIKRKQQEQTEAMKLVQKLKNINLRQAEILKEFIKNPEKSFEISEVRTQYGTAYDTARNDLLNLAKSGHIKKIRINNKFVFRLNENKT